MPFDIHIDLSDVYAACAEADDELRRAPAVMARLAADEGLTEAKARRTYRDRTGQLSNRATARMVGIAGTEATSEITWPVPYASYVEGGTRPHTITARRAGALAFPGAGGGTVLRRSVSHPGTAPRPFAGPALIKAERVLTREAEDTIARVARILGR